MFSMTLRESMVGSFPFVSLFLDAPSHLYMRSCPSVGPSVRPVLFSKVKSTHTRRILCRVSGLVLSRHGFCLDSMTTHGEMNNYLGPWTMIHGERVFGFCAHCTQLAWGLAWLFDWSSISDGVLLLSLRHFGPRATRTRTKTRTRTRTRTRNYPSVTLSRVRKSNNWEQHQGHLST